MRIRKLCTSTSTLASKVTTDPSLWRVSTSNAFGRVSLDPIVAAYRCAAYQALPQLCRGAVLFFENRTRKGGFGRIASKAAKKPPLLAGPPTPLPAHGGWVAGGRLR